MRASAGAGDRLGLQCDVTGECVPTAMLPYCGRTLLEGLLRDLQVRPGPHTLQSTVHSLQRCCCARTVPAPCNCRGRNCL